MQKLIEEQLTNQGRFDIEDRNAAEQVARLSARVARGDTASVWMADDASGTMILEASFGSLILPEKAIRLHLGDSIEGWAWQNAGEMASEDVLLDSRLAGTALLEEGIRSLVVVPLLWNGAVRGLLSAGRRVVKPFSSLDSGSLAALAGIVSALSWPPCRSKPSSLQSSLSPLRARGGAPPVGRGAADIGGELREIVGKAAADLSPLACLVLVESGCCRGSIIQSRWPAAEQQRTELEHWLREVSSTLPRLEREMDGRLVLIPGPLWLDADSGLPVQSSAAVLPLESSGPQMGVMALLYAGMGNQLQGVQLSLFEALADRASLVIRNSELFHSLVENRRQLHQLRVHKEGFLPVIGHNLRTPLTSIIGFAQLMMRETAEMGTRPNPVETILEESTRLAMVVEEVVALENMEERIAGLNPDTVSLSALLEAAMNGAGRREDLAGKIDVPCTCRDFLVRADRNEMQKVIGTLLRRLVSLSKSGSAVRVTALRSGGRVRLVFRVLMGQLKRQDLLEALEKPYNENGRADRMRRSMAHDFYVARNLTEAQGGVMRSRWRGEDELALILILPGVGNLRGER